MKQIPRPNCEGLSRFGELKWEDSSKLGNNSFPWAGFKMNKKEKGS